jgi:hypothetical protein
LFLNRLPLASAYRVWYLWGCKLVLLSSGMKEKRADWYHAMIYIYAGVRCSEGYAQEQWKEDTGDVECVRKRYSQVLVNLSTFPVLPQQSPQNPHPPQPHNLGWHPRLCCTLPFTVSSVSTQSFSSEGITSSSSRVDNSGFDDTTHSFTSAFPLSSNP